MLCTFKISTIQIDFFGVKCMQTHTGKKYEGFSMLITWKIGQSELKRFSSCVEKHPTET